MKKSIWKDIVNRTQYENLPLITGCIFGVLVMATMRDLVNQRDLTAGWMYVIEFGCPALSLGIWIASFSGIVSSQQSQNVATLSLLCIGVKASMATTNWYPGETPDTVMLTLFAAGVAMLSFRHVIIAQSLIFLLWLTPTLLDFGFSATFANILFCLAGAGVGLIILDRRIANLRNILALEHRVETLESILPMCSGCKKTRDENGNWMSVESYIEAQEEGTLITHSLCPDCKEKHYGDHLRNLQRRQEKEG